MNNNIHPLFNAILEAHGCYGKFNPDPLVDKMRSLNPSKDEQAILLYGSDYNLWRNGEYIGVGKWVKDDNIGDSFQAREGDNITVFIADKWELIIK